MVNNIASGPGNLQVVRKVVVTEGKLKNYWNEIQQSYELGFTPYRIHKNTDGTFVTPIRYYVGWVCVLDNVATMEVGDRSLTEDRRGPSGARGLKGDSGDKGPVGSQAPSGIRGVEGPEGPPGMIGKMGPVGSKGGIGAYGEKGDKGDIGVVGQQGPIGPRGSTGSRGV